MRFPCKLENHCLAICVVLVVRSCVGQRRRYKETQVQSLGQNQNLPCNTVQVILYGDFEIWEALN